MAFLTAKGISRTAIALLTRTLVLPMTATRIPGEEFAGSNGDTITIRVPVPATASIQVTPGAGPITYDTLDETPVDVTLGHLYHATRITDEDLSLAMESFAEQVTLKQVSAVATLAEDQLAGVMNVLPAEEDIADQADVERAVLAAREALGEANVPSGGRWLAVSPQVATFLLRLDKFSRVDASGTDSALRDAIIGRIYGFQVVESNALNTGTAVAYHQSGFVFGNRTPVIPRGAADSATATEGGVGLRQIFQYDPDVLSDASVISTFAGAALVDADRVVKLTTAGAPS